MLRISRLVCCTAIGGVLSMFASRKWSLGSASSFSAAASSGIARRARSARPPATGSSSPVVATLKMLWNIARRVFASPGTRRAKRSPSDMSAAAERNSPAPTKSAAPTQLKSTWTSAERLAFFPLASEASTTGVTAPMFAPIVR